MSASKLSYRVRTRLEPHLESLGFHRALPPREWVRITNQVMCALSMTKAIAGGEIREGSFALTAGVAYPAPYLAAPGSDMPSPLHEPERYGIGSCRIFAQLTRSIDIDGPTRSDVWDPSATSHDEAIADAVTAIDTQATPFFDEWTDHERAYERLLGGEFRPNPAPTSQHGTAELFVWAPSDSMGGQIALSVLATHLGRTDAEIHHLEEANRISDELTGLGVGHSEAVNQRLQDLKRA